MISKNKIKELRLLHTKKGRQNSHSFLVEGDKIVKELLTSSFSVKAIIGLPEWKSNLSDKTRNLYEEVNAHQLNQISALKTPNQVVAVVEMPEPPFDLSILQKKLTIAIDSLQDPGNFGTILRIANWFGIKHIICSEDTVDVFNPKVIQASMGAIFRVDVFYMNLISLLRTIPEQTSVYGTFLAGSNIYQTALNNNAIMLFGNESKGISNEIEQFVDQKLLIPPFPPDNQTMESLNVSTAVAITCAEFRRQLTIRNEKTT